MAPSASFDNNAKCPYAAPKTDAANESSQSWFCSETKLVKKIAGWIFTLSLLFQITCLTVFFGSPQRAVKGVLQALSTLAPSTKKKTTSDRDPVKNDKWTEFEFSTVLSSPHPPFIIPEDQSKDPTLPPETRALFASASGNMALVEKLLTIPE